MDLVTDAVARTRKRNAVLGSKGLKKSMIITVLKSSLEGIMVNITDGSFGPNAGHAEGLVLQTRHGARGILRKGLVDGKLYGLSWRGRLFNAMAYQDFVEEGFTRHN
jgi:hypothetical protein